MEEQEASSFTWIKPNHYGSIFVIAWMFILLYSPVGLNNIFPGIEFASAAYISSAVTLSLTLALVAFRPKKAIDWANSKTVRLATPAVMAVGTVLYLLFHLNGMVAVGIVGGILTGATSALLSARWVREFSCLKTEELLVNLPALAAVAVAFCLTLLYFPREAIFTALVLMPFASEILLERAQMQSASPQVRKDPIIKKGSTGYVFIVLIIGVIGLSTGFVDSMIGKGFFTLAFYAIIIALLFISTPVFIFKNERRFFGSAYVLPVVLLAAILVPFSSMFAQNPAQIFVSVGEICFEVLLFTLMVVYAYFFKISPVSTYCIGRISMALPNVCGWLAGDYFIASNLIAESQQVGLVLTLLGAESVAIIVLAALAISRGFDAKRDAAEEPAAETGSAASADGQQPQQPTIEELFRERCSSLPGAHDLSEREMDVLVLLAQGYSSPAIQETLHIAAGTVNSHTRNIYQKLDVHSKGEVITLVGKQ